MAVTRERRCHDLRPRSAAAGGHPDCRRARRTVHRGRWQSGQGSVEYVGMVVAVGVLLVGLVAVFPSIGDSVACKLSQAVASITGGSGDCSGGAADAQETEGDENNGGSGDPAVATYPTPKPWQPPPPEPPPPPPGIPYGLDPSSDLVKTMQTTARGRDALRWLRDHNVRVNVSPAENGAWYQPRGPFGIGGYIGLGNGYDDAATLIHETNHARNDKGYRSSAFNIPSRGNYVHGKIHEETDGTVQAIQAAQEFRAAGRNLPTQPGETEYDNAYQNAKASGANNVDSEKAGYEAVEQLFYSGAFVTSLNSKTYMDYYGDEWDSANLCFLFPWCD